MKLYLNAHVVTTWRNGQRTDSAFLNEEAARGCLTLSKNESRDREPEMNLMVVSVDADVVAGLE
jgi:hypothetical protein